MLQVHILSRRRNQRMSTCSIVELSCTSLCFPNISIVLCMPNAKNDSFKIKSVKNTGLFFGIAWS